MRIEPPAGQAAGAAVPIAATLGLPGLRRVRSRQWRLRMLRAIGASYVLDTAILLLYAAAGTTTLRVPLLYALAGGLLFAVQLSVYLSPLGSDSRDPFLTLWFTVPAVVLQLAFLHVAPEVGFVFLTVTFIVFGFGAIRLTQQEAVITWVVTALSVAALLPFFDRQLAIPFGSAAERWTTGLCFLLTLGRCATIGAFSRVVRERLAERTAALQSLTASLEQQVAERTAELSRANAELERLVAERTAEIRTLRGVLPICSYCKKIRDDRGAWNQLESYISAHADVLFSHGICADCRQEHFPTTTAAALKRPPSS